MSREIVDGFISNTGGIESMTQLEVFRWVSEQVGYPIIGELPDVLDSDSNIWGGLDDFMYTKLLVSS